MASDLKEFLPSAATIVAIDTEDLAGLLIEFLHSKRDGRDPDWPRNIMSTAYICSDKAVSAYDGPVREQVSQALSEAWAWLEQRGIIVPRPMQHSDWERGYYAFSRRGSLLKTRTQVAEYRKRERLPKDFLHSSIADAVWPLFLGGKYETAVFEAFKAVEVAVRAAGHFTETDLGVNLMRDAFKEGSGPLADRSEPSGEQQSLAHLFAGAIGRFKNPASHRHTAITDAAEAFEMLVIASHLMRVVLDRATKPAARP